MTVREFSESINRFFDKSWDFIMNLQIYEAVLLGIGLIVLWMWFDGAFDKKNDSDPYGY